MKEYKFILQSLLYSDLVLYVQTTDKRFAFSGLDTLFDRYSFCSFGNEMVSAVF
jgi:hypothetical protein